MARGTPEEIAQRYADRMTQSLEQIERGVNAVEEAPGVKAAAQQEKWLRGIQKAANEGTWAQHVASVTLQEWQTAFIQKGLPRISAGVANARPRMIAFHTQLQQFRQSLDRELDAMPTVTLEQRLNKMMTNARKMSNFRFKR